MFAELRLQGRGRLAELLPAELHVGQLVLELFVQVGILGLGQARRIGLGGRADGGRFWSSAVAPVGRLLVLAAHVEPALGGQRAVGDISRPACGRPSPPRRPGSPRSKAWPSS